MKCKNIIAKQIVKAIEKDILDRCGIGVEFNKISDSTKIEIRQTWKKLILEILKPDID